VSLASFTAPSTSAEDVPDFLAFLTFLIPLFSREYRALRCSNFLFATGPLIVEKIHCSVYQFKPARNIDLLD